MLAKKSVRSFKSLWFQDYHVILLHKRAEGSIIYDMDTHLGMPVLFTDYAKQTFGSEQSLYPQYKR